MKILLPALPLLLAGCHSRPAQAPAVSLPIAAPVETRDARTVATVGHYTLGAYVDPDNHFIRHEAHAIQRLEREARWDLRPMPLGTPAFNSPTAGLTDAPLPSVAVPEEVTEAVAAPVTPIPPPSEAGKGDSDPAAPIVVPEPAQDEIPALVPNADGLVDLTAADLPVDSGNPFAVRVPGPGTTREVSLAVGGIVRGSSPCALINGRLVEPGESVDALRLIRLEPAAVLLQHDGRFVRLPVAATPVRIRIAL